MSIQGIVFDVDGVLFDTEQLSRQIWETVSTEFGYPQVGQRYLEFVGNNRTDTFEKLERYFGPDFPKETFLLTCSERLQKHVEEYGVPLKPGVHEILDFLSAQHIPIALATSTGQQRTQRRMDLSGLAHYFCAMITGDQVTHSKPHPEIYQMACEQLHLAPPHVLAIEDSKNGILSASGAGMQVAMVPDLIPPTQQLDALLTCRCASLLELKDWIALHLER